MHLLRPAGTTRDRLLNTSSPPDSPQAPHWTVGRSSACNGTSRSSRAPARLFSSSHFCSMRTGIFHSATGNAHGRLPSLTGTSHLTLRYCNVRSIPLKELLVSDNSYTCRASADRQMNASLCTVDLSNAAHMIQVDGSSFYICAFYNNILGHVCTKICICHLVTSATWCYFISFFSLLLIPIATLPRYVFRNHAYWSKHSYGT